MDAPEAKVKVVKQWIDWFWNVPAGVEVSDGQWPYQSVSLPFKGGLTHFAAGLDLWVQPLILDWWSLEGGCYMPGAGPRKF